MHDGQVLEQTSIHEEFRHNVSVLLRRSIPSSIQQKHSWLFEIGSTVDVAGGGEQSTSVNSNFRGGSMGL